MASEAKINFTKNTWEIDRLFTIHADISGVDSGRRYQVEVLNKSAVILITGCWEAYIEDVVEECFGFLLNNCDDPHKIPPKARLPASNPLKDSNDPRKIWELAGSGWRKILKNNKECCLKRFIGNFNTPKPKNIDDIFENVIGFSKISSRWKWRGMSKTNSHNKLIKYVEMRGAIAHRSRHTVSVTKPMAEDYLDFIYRLVNITDDCLRDHIKGITNKYPWPAEWEDELSWQEKKK